MPLISTWLHAAIKLIKSISILKQDLPVRKRKRQKRRKGFKNYLKMVCAQQVIIMKIPPLLSTALLTLSGSCHAASALQLFAAPLSALPSCSAFSSHRCCPHFQCSSDHDCHRRCLFLFEHLQVRGLRTSLRVFGRTYRAHRG